MWSIKVNLGLLNAVDFVIFVVDDFVVVVVVVVVIDVVTLLVVTDHIVFSCGQQKLF